MHHRKKPEILKKIKGRRNAGDSGNRKKKEKTFRPNSIDTDMYAELCYSNIVFLKFLT